MARKRSPHDIGKELEDRVADWLEAHHVSYVRNRKFLSPFGLWDIDFWVADPPTLISCKNPTSEARSPGGSARRKAQEAFLQLSGLMLLCPEVPPAAQVILITGDLPLRTRGTDYEAVLQRLLGARFTIVSVLQLDRLVKTLLGATTDGKRGCNE